MSKETAEWMKLTEDQHRELGKSLNQETWSLLEKSERTGEENERMVHAAHASLYHWLHAGTPLHHQRGVWLISRVYASFGMAETAISYAERCMQLTEQHKDLMEDFDLAYACEGIARACACGSFIDAAQEYKEAARKLGDMIADEEDKKIFAGDFAAEPWFDVE